MRAKLTPEQKAKREAKRQRREDRVDVPLPRDPTFGDVVARTNLVFVAQRSVQRHIRSAALRLVDAETESGTRSSCHACTSSGCCTMPVQVMLHEALAIADALRREGRDTPALREALLASAERMETFARHAEPKACVFLDGNLRCSVYEARPRECGEHYVFCDPLLCGDPKAPAISKLTVPIDIEEREKIERQFETEARLAPLDGPYVGYLPRAVLILLEAWDRTDYVANLEESGRDAQTRILAVVRQRG
ncbi:MAG: YkgJ family cysteine cluster protein [Kofleriaceae bacterium]